VTDEGRRAAVSDELSASAEDLGAARTLIDAGFLRAAMTRVYDAAFHAERALVLALGHEPRSHEGVHHLLQLHFIRTGVVEARWSRVLARLQKYRESADYGGAVVFERASLEEDLAEAAAFCARAREILVGLGFASI
jgi:uncharacterized protein (UPF0332 family)